MTRRQLPATACGAGAVAQAGRLGRGGGTTTTRAGPHAGTLVVATDQAFVAARSTSPGEWTTDDAQRQAETVTHTAEDLQGRLDGWGEQWAERIVQG